MKKFLLVLAVLIFILAFLSIGFVFVKKVNGDELVLIKVGEEQLVGEVYKTPIVLAENLTPEKVASFQCNIIIESDAEGIKIEYNPPFSLTGTLLKGENPTQKVLVNICSSVSLKDKAKITLSEIEVEMRREALAPNPPPPVTEEEEKTEPVNPGEKLDQLLAQQDQIQSSLDDLYEKGLNNQMSLTDLATEEARLQDELENISEETSTLLSIYGKRDELKERKGEKADIKDASSPYREAAKLKAETDRGDRYLEAFRRQRYLAEKKIAQGQEKKRLARKIAALKPPREKFFSANIGAFGNAHTYYKKDNYYSSSYNEYDNSTYSSTSGYFVEFCLRTPSIGERLEGAVFGAWTSVSPGWYGGAEARLILADEGYRCLITTGALTINSAIHAKIGLLVDSPSWTFFVAGIPGAENNFQIGLGYKF